MDMKKNKNRLIGAVLTGVMLTSGIPGTLPLCITSYAASPTVKAPKDFKATAESSSVIKLTWTKSKGADAYRIYYTDTSTGESKVYKDVTGKSCKVTGLSAATTYTFTVVPLVDNEGKYIEQASKASVKGKTKQGDKFVALDKLQALRVTDTSVKLSWGHVNGSEKYRVYVYNESTKKYDKAADTKELTTVIKGLKPGTKYTFAVASIYIDPDRLNSFTASRKSKNVTVTTPETPKDSYLVLPEFGLSKKEVAKFEGLQVINSSEKFSGGSIRCEVYDDKKIILQKEGGKKLNFEEKSLYFTPDDKLFMCTKFIGINDATDRHKKDDFLNEQVAEFKKRRGNETKSFLVGDKTIYFWKGTNGQRSEFLVVFKALTAYDLFFSGTLDLSLVPDEFRKDNERDMITNLTSAINTVIRDKNSGLSFNNDTTSGNKVIAWSMIKEEIPTI